MILSSWQGVAGLYLLVIGFAAAVESHPDVLVLHSYHPATWSNKMFNGVASVLGEEEGPHYFVEYMDTKKIKTDAYLDGLYSLYQQKYGDQPFDVIIATDDNAYQFVLRHHTDLFKNAPLVFCGVSDFDPLQIADRPVTGVLEIEPDEEELLLAFSLLPETKKVYFICDYTTTAVIHLEKCEQIMARRYPDVEYEVLRDLTADQMVTALASAEQDSFIVCIAWWFDKDGNAVLQDELADIIKQANRPVFTFAEWLVTRGALGGKVISPYRQGVAAGVLAQKILAGQSPASLGILDDSDQTTQYLFDYELLKHYQVSESLLPKDAVILNQSSHFKMISEERWQMIKVGSVVLLVLVCFLLLFVYYRQKVHRIVRESEERYRGLVETTSDWIWELNAQGVSTFDSPQVEDAIGYRPEEVKGKKPFDFMTPEEAGRQMASFNQYNAERKPFYHLLFNLIHKNGQPVVVETNGIPIFDAKGRLIGYRGVSRVVTDRARTEKMLEEQRAEIQSIFKASPIGIGLVCDRVLMRVNDHICEMTGYSREELIGQSARMLYRSDEDHAYVGAEKYRQIAERGTGTVEIPWLRKDGTLIDVLLSSTPLDITDLSKGVTFTALDITNRKQAEVERIRTLKFNEALVNAIPSPLFYKDTEGRYLGCNKAFEEHTGRSSEEIKGKTVHECWPGEDANVYHQKDMELMQHPEFQSYEFQMLNAQNQERDVIFAKDVFYDELGQVAGIIGVFVDITERKEAEKQLRQRTHDLERFEKLAIGRELKMVELKNQIKDLKQKLRSQSGGVK